jgi:hypothetical protein
LVKTLLGGTRRQTDGQKDRGQTDRQTDDLISLTFLFEESRLKIAIVGNEFLRCICSEEEEDKNLLNPGHYFKFNKYYNF